MQYQGLNNKKGETLIEVIAALTSLVLAGIAAMTLIISVMTSTAISKEYLIAQNLAREAIEGVTNIRDTNWLLFPSDKAKCWLDLDGTSCKKDGTEIVKTTDYYILKKTDNKFLLENKGVLNASDPSYQLWVVTGNIYSHDQAGKIDPQPTPTFYRQITFSKVDSADVNLEERVQVKVVVSWTNKSTPTKYELSSVITNYAK